MKSASKGVKKVSPRYSEKGKAAAAEKSGSGKLEEPAVGYIVSPVNLTINYLGGKHALRGAKVPQSDYEYIDLINAGLPKLSFDYLLNITGLSITEMADIFNITDRTLRRYTPNTVLSREQSERAVEIARLYNRGNEVLGTLEYFKVWMNSPLPVLGGKKPKTCLGTSLGISLLTKILGRMEYGVYS